MKVFVLGLGALLCFLLNAYELQAKPPSKPETQNARVNSNDTVYFALVSVKPTFKGGDINSFSKWVHSKIVLPADYADICISGKVIIQFCVNKRGKVCEVKVLRSLEKLFDDEVVRVVKSSPRWKPGKMNGKRANVIAYTIVSIRL